MKKTTILLVISTLFLGLFPGGEPAHSSEPSMSDYTATPIFMTTSITPNILIILDNSGSMNYAAYGTWAGDNGAEITDELYSGNTPYSNSTTVRVSQSRDDAEERPTDDTAWYNSSDLDLGGYSTTSNDAIVGIRFQNVNVPQGATITNAYIEFTAKADSSTAPANTNFTIRGQLDDDTDQFSATLNNIDSRPRTAASVAWSNVSAWTHDTTYQTPDIKEIVQEIVNRTGWVKGNSMVFIFSGTGKRDAKSYDNSHSEAPLLHIEFTPAERTLYYGLFDPDAQYKYSSNKFVRDPNGEWNGNWLNWLSMRRIDVAKKVLVGGLATSRTGGGNTTLYGDDHNAQPSRYWKRQFDSSLSGVSVTPYNGNYWYGIKGGYIYVDDDSNPFSGYIERYKIAVKKDEADEPDEFLDGNIAGVIQRVGSRARFGLEFYNNDEGGRIQVAVKAGSMTNMVTQIENMKADTWTPLAEAFYEGVRYFQQVSPYYFNGDYQTNHQKDPYYWDDRGDFVECGKSFILLITDGESTQDKNIPTGLRDYDGDENDPGSYDYNGSDYLDDVALWARTNDLRSDLDGDQNIIFYTVFAFGQGSTLLQDAAKNGGFEDRDGDDRPNLTSEWDSDGDGTPDTYFEAPNGYQLEAQLLRAITDILKRAAAGTAVSVLATSGEGEGNLVQAYFRPTVTSGVTDVKWVGYLQSLWVDSYGNLHEDTDGDRALDPANDKVVEYYFDSATGDSKIRRFTDFVPSGTTPYPDVGSDAYEILDLEDINPLWEAGEILSTRDPDERKIFTYLDMDKDQQVDEPVGDDDPFDDDGEVVAFDLSGVTKIKPYLGVKDFSAWNYLGWYHDDRAKTLIEYIRGKDTGLSGTTTLQVRSRTLNGNVWKLGDIVHSTPVSIAKPPDNYHIIYADESYMDYLSGVSNRETVVYVGANDGMLHAFTSWCYSGTSKQYTKPSAAPSGEHIGEELWAYIPQALLPHLKWLPKEDYSHVYYVDLKPKIFDAKILPDDTHYVDADGDDNWGTILLAGLNLGGKHIWAEGDFDDGSGVTVSETRHFYPSYFCMDVTDPRNPRLLWERTYQDLGLTTSIPAIVKVKDKWFAVFGSGPETFDGESTQKAHVYVVDLKTGDAYPDISSFASGTTDAWLFSGSENNAFMNSPVSLDKNLNYNVDAIYLGETYKQGSSWKGKIYKVMIPWDWSDVSSYEDNPIHSGNEWKFKPLFTSDRPITSPLSLSIDFFDNVWVYFGTGRYLSDSDKSTTDTQYLYGLVDPFFNSYYDSGSGGYYHSYAYNKELSRSDLFEADDYVITSGGTVFVGSTEFGNWNDLLVEARNYDGWYRTLLTTRERAITKPSVFGGIVFFPTFVPNDDICGFGGDSYLYALYFETGTAYYEPVFPGQTQDFTVGSETYQQVLDKVSLGSGKSSSLGFHVGQEEGTKAFIQQSTGTVLDVDTNPAFNIKSGLINWRQP
ncbi:MAG: hypothetical protein JRF57_00720 [Deltaproteobacteria bacterium]|nr:hypothetical protein [Deltaproteobacteria bacterium]